MFIANEEHTSVTFSIHLDFFVSTLSPTVSSEQIILFFFFFFFVGCNQPRSLLQVSLAFFPRERENENQHSASTAVVSTFHLCPPCCCTVTVFIHPVLCRDEVTASNVSCCFRLNPTLIHWTLQVIDQSSVLRQIDVAVWSRGGDHMTLQSRQAQGSNVIRECSCVSALLHTLLSCFQGRTRQPCHFVHFRLSSGARAPFSLFLLSVTLSQC